MAKPTTTGTCAIVTVLILLGTVLLLVGLVGLYVCHSETAGLLGLVGLLMSFLGNALVVGAVWEASLVVPWLAWGLLSCWSKGPRSGEP